MSTTPNIKSLATQKLEDVVFKSMQIVQSQSYRQISTGGEVIAYPSPTYDAMFSVILRNATASPMIHKKRDEAFRNGLHVAPNFVSKCYLCASEYDFITEECDKCGGKTRKPHPDEEEVLVEILKLRNVNNQNLEDVLKIISIDHDIVDDGWLVSRNIYQEINGEIIDFEIVEFWRIHPGNASFSMSDAHRIGEYEFTCLYHREYYSHEEFDTCNYSGCGRLLHKVIAVRFRDQQVEMRYIKEEIYHGSEYNPSAVYGFPPALTMWYNLVLTSAQEKFMADYYVEKKWPTAAIFVPAKRRETALAFKERLDEQTNKDIQARPVFRFDPTAKHKPEVIRLTDTPQEMEFIQVREESRMRMAAFWGISPIFNADVQASGGLNNESRQITVQSWATESKQKSIRQNYLDLIVENVKVVDWHIEFTQLEEEDAAAEVQLDQLRAIYAQSMQSLGFKVELDKDGKPTKFSEMPEGSDPFGAMSPMMEKENPIAQMGQNLGGQQSVLMQNTKSDDENMENEFLNTKEENSRVITKNDLLKYTENSNKSDYYTFTQKYGDWEWKDKYEFFKFENIVIEDLNVHPDFEIKKEDVENDSPRVRKGTLDYYANETTEMEPFIVDPNYNLLDGHHRLYALEDKKQENLTVAVVLPKHQDIEINTKAEDLFEKYVKAKFDKYKVDPSQRRGRPRKHPKEGKKNKKDGISLEESIKSPEKMLADRFFYIEKEYLGIKNKLNSLEYKSLGKNLVFVSKQLPKAKEALEKKNPSIVYSKDYMDMFYYDSYETREEAVEGMLRDIQIDVENYTEDIINYEEKAELRRSMVVRLNNIKDEYETLKDIPIRKDGNLWGYYNNTPMKHDDEFYNTPDNRFSDAIKLVMNEANWIAERLGIDVSGDHPLNSVNFIKSPPKDLLNQSEDTLAYVQYSTNTIMIKIDVINNIANFQDNALQNVIRHELAHYFESWKQYPNIHSKIKRLKEIELMGANSDTQWTLSLMNEGNKLEKDVMRFRAHQISNHHHKEDRFKGGHGKDWQDTMEILYGKKPTGKSIGDHSIPTKENL